MIKKLSIVCMILLLLFVGVSSCNALDKTKNQTIEMDGIKFCTPATDNYTITNVTGKNGAHVFTYSDDKNNITIYISDKDMTEYKLYTEEWNQYDGYTQYRPIGGKYIMVGSTYEENKDFIWDSLGDLNPEYNTLNNTTK